MILDVPNLNEQATEAFGCAIKHASVNIADKSSKDTLTSFD